jgi:hypothetical protein
MEKDTFVYNLNNVDSLIFKTNSNCFELFSRYEEFDEISIGRYEKGRWKFVDYKQQLIFFQLFGIYKNETSYAIRAYNRYIHREDSLYKLKSYYRLYKINLHKKFETLTSYLHLNTKKQ